jgi:hypothetical protein
MIKPSVLSFIQMIQFVHFVLLFSCSLWNYKTKTCYIHFCLKKLLLEGSITNYYLLILCSNENECPMLVILRISTDIYMFMPYIFYRYLHLGSLWLVKIWWTDHLSVSMYEQYSIASTSLSCTTNYCHWSFPDQMSCCILF